MARCSYSKGTWNSVKYTYVDGSIVHTRRQTFNAHADDFFSSNSRTPTHPQANWHTLDTPPVSAPTPFLNLNKLSLVEACTEVAHQTKYLDRRFCYLFIAFLLLVAVARQVVLFRAEATRHFVYRKTKWRSLLVTTPLHVCGLGKVYTYMLKHTNGPHCQIAFNDTNFFYVLQTF